MRQHSAKLCYVGSGQQRWSKYLSRSMDTSKSKKVQSSIIINGTNTLVELFFLLHFFKLPTEQSGLN